MGCKELYHYNHMSNIHVKQVTCFHPWSCHRFQSTQSRDSISPRTCTWLTRPRIHFNTMIDPDVILLSHRRNFYNASNKPGRVACVLKESVGTEAGLEVLRCNPYTLTNLQQFHLQYRNVLVFAQVWDEHTYVSVFISVCMNCMWKVILEFSIQPNWIY